MPEHEDGHPRVLDPGLDGDGDDVLPLAVAELGEQAAKAEAKPWQSKANQSSSPSDQFEHEELRPDAADQDEDDEEEGKGLHEPDHEVGRLGQALADGDADEKRDNEKHRVLCDREIRDVTDVGACHDRLSKKEHPDGHHEERGKSGHCGHRDRQIKVASKHNCPDVRGSAAWRGSCEEKTKSHLWVVEDEAKSKGAERHEDELGNKADGRTNRFPEHLLHNVQVKGAAKVDVGKRDEDCHRVAEYLRGGLLGLASCDCEVEHQACLLLFKHDLDGGEAEEVAGDVEHDGGVDRGGGERKLEPGLLVKIIRLLLRISGKSTRG